MNKPPEEIAEEYLNRDDIISDAINHDAEDLVKLAFLNGFSAGQQMKSIEKWKERDCFNLGHPIQVKAREHAKLKSSDYGVQLFAESCFIAGYNEALKESK